MNQKNIISVFIALAILIVFIIVIYSAKQRYQANPLISTPSPSSSSMSERILTPEEQAVLKIPLHYDPPEQKIQHTQQVTKLATTAPELDITSCKPIPTVYQIKLNGSFKVINNDPIPHTLRYMSSHILIPAHGSTTVTTSKLFKVSGDYGYGCDNPFAKAGIIVVR